MAASRRRQDARPRGDRWEVRATVSERTLDLFDEEAEHRDRKRTHVLGRVLDLWAFLLDDATPRERAQLDAAAGRHNREEVVDVLLGILARRKKDSTPNQI